MRDKRFTALLGACVLFFLASDVGAQHDLPLEWYVDSGKRAVKEHRFDKAEEYYLAALREASASYPRLADSIVSLAEIYVAQGKPEAAERLFRRALATQKQILGPGHPAVADSLNSQ